VGNALITGIHGFVGGHLGEFLLRQGIGVVGIQHIRYPKPLKPSPMRLYTCDLRDHKKLLSIVRQSKPDYVFHLAARNQADDSLSGFRDLFETNVIGTLHLLRAIQESCSPKILIAMSSAFYGITPARQKIRESRPPGPVTPYGVSKAAQELLAHQYAHEGLKILIARNFNLVGPRQPAPFVCSGLARQFVEIKRGWRKAEIRVGNLKSRRDFCDVRDAVRAYWLIMQRGRLGEAYNVCSERSYSIETVVRALMKITGVKGNIVIDSSRLKKIDIPSQVGSYAKLMRHTGWRPEIALDRSLRDLVAYWEAVL
jgi:GDP-4-dehydro-6-deoxy-D-mannose reductase